MSDQENLPPGKPSTKAAERLAVIVDAAERAALSVIDDAEKEARRYLEDAQARADLIVAERLREAADMLERHRADELAGGARLEPVAEQPPVSPEPAPSADRLSALDLEEKEDEAAPTTAPDEVAETAVAAEMEEVAPPEEVAGPEPEPEPAPAVVPAPEPPKTEGRAPGSAAARLLATQMAVSGSSRKEIEMRLRNGFEIEDTSEILDAILGPEE